MKISTNFPNWDVCVSSQGISWFMAPRSLGRWSLTGFTCCTQGSQTTTNGLSEPPFVGHGVVMMMMMMMMMMMIMLMMSSSSVSHSLMKHIISSSLWWEWFCNSHVLIMCSILTKCDQAPFCFLSDLTSTYLGRSATQLPFVLFETALASRAFRFWLPKVSLARSVSAVRRLAGFLIRSMNIPDMNPKKMPGAPGVFQQWNFPNRTKWWFRMGGKSGFLRLKKLDSMGFSPICDRFFPTLGAIFGWSYWWKSS